MNKIIKLSYLMLVSALIALSALAAGVDIVLHVDNKSSCGFVKVNEAATNARLSAPGQIKAKSLSQLIVSLNDDDTWFSQKLAFSQYGVSCDKENEDYDAFFELKVMPAEYGNRMVLCWSSEFFEFVDIFPDDYEFVDRDCIALNSPRPNLEFVGVGAE